MAGPNDIILTLIADVIKAQADIAEFADITEEQLKQLDDVAEAISIDDQFSTLGPLVKKFRDELLQTEKGLKGLSNEGKKAFVGIATELVKIGKYGDDAGTKVATSGKKAEAAVKKLQTSLARAVEEYRHLSKQPGFKKSSAEAKEAAAAVKDFATKLRDSSNSLQSLKQVNRAFELIGKSTKDVKNKLDLLTEEFKQLQAQPGFDRASKQAKQLAAEIDKAAKELKEFSSEATHIRTANNAFKLLTKSTKELRDDVDRAKHAMLELWKQPGFKKSSKEALEAEANFKKAAAALMKVSHSAADLKRVSVGMQKVQKSAKSLSTGFRRLQSVAAGFGVTLGLIGLVRFVKNAVNAKIAMERIQQSLIAATGSAEKAAVAYKFIDDTVIELGLDLNSSAQSFSQLAAAAKGTSLEGAQLEKVFHAVAVSGRVLNLSTDQIKGTIVALRQMIGKARVSAEELRRQLGDRIPGAFELAARAMGVTTRELDKMMERGELLAVDLLPRLSEEMLNTFGPGLGKALDSTAAKVARLGTEWFKVQVAFGEGLAEGLGETLEATGKGLKGLRDGAEVAGQAFGGLGKVVGWFGEKLALTNSQIQINRKSVELYDAQLAGETETVARLTEELEELRGKQEELVLSYADSASASQKMVQELMAQGKALADTVERLRALGEAAPRDELEETIEKLHQLTTEISRLEESAKTPKLLELSKQANRAALAFEETEQHVRALIDNMGEAISIISQGGTLGAEQAKKTVAGIDQVIARIGKLSEKQQAAFGDTVEGLKKYKLEALEQLKGFDEVLKEFGFKTRAEIEASIGSLSRFIEGTQDLGPPTAAIADSIIEKYEEIAESIATLPEEQQAAAFELLAQLGNVSGDYEKFTTKFAKDSEKAAKKSKKAWDGFADGVLDLFEIISREAAVTGEKIRKGFAPPGDTDESEGKSVEELTASLAELQAEKQGLQDTPLLSLEDVERMGELNDLIADYRQAIRRAAPPSFGPDPKDPALLAELAKNAGDYREAVRELTVENEGFREVFLAATEDTQNEIQGIIEHYELLIESTGGGADAAEDFGRSMSRALAKVEGVPADLVNQFDSLGKGVRDVSDLFDDLRKGTEGSAGGMQKLAESAKTTQEAMKEIADRTKEFATQAKQAGEEAALGFEALNAAINQTEMRLGHALSLCKELKECMAGGG